MKSSTTTSRHPDPSPGANPSLRRVVARIMMAYLRVWHRAELHGTEHIPKNGPCLLLTNHASLIDVPTLIAFDPFPNSTFIAKASLFRVPVVRDVLRAWGAIPVERKGNDLAGMRAVLTALKRGQIVAVAAEGRRTRSGGRLEPVNRVLAHLAVVSQLPIMPVGISGSYRALPPGAWFPRPAKVVVRVGPVFTVPRGSSDDEAANLIRAHLARLLSPEQQPLDEGPDVLGSAPPRSAGSTEP